MTYKIDTFLVGRGFECQEIKDIKHRSGLYLGIFIAGVFAITFLGLALTAWT